MLQFQVSVSFNFPLIQFQFSSNSQFHDCYPFYYYFFIHMLLFFCKNIFHLYSKYKKIHQYSQFSSSTIHFLVVFKFTQHFLTIERRKDQNKLKLSIQEVYEVGQIFSYNIISFSNCKLFVNNEEAFIHFKVIFIFHVPSKWDKNLKWY